MAELRDQLQARLRESAHYLMPLAPPHPYAHSKIIALEGTTKHAPVVTRAATVDDYVRHLSPAAYDGVGALGMFPGASVVSEQGKPRWFAPFLALDFDAHMKESLIPLVTTLEGYGFHVYLSDGTTGRGSHLYIFPDGKLPQWKAYAVVRVIQSMARDVGLGEPEVRPSCESGRGSPIFLPYRGGGIDGMGFNPLWELGIK